MIVFSRVVAFRASQRIFPIRAFVLAASLCIAVGIWGSRNHAEAATSPQITLVQQAELSVSSGASSVSQSFSAASSSGDLIVATVKWGGQNLSVTSITDNKGNTYQSVLGPTDWGGTAKDAQTFVAKNIVGGGSPVVITVELSGASSSNLHLYQFEYSGADPNTPIDVSTSETGTGTALGSPTITTNYADDRLHAVAFTGSGTTAPGSGFQALTTYGGNLVETEIAASAGSYSATASDSVSAQWFIHLLAIKPASSGTSSSAPPTVSITAPASGATVSGTVSVSAAITDSNATASLQFQLDNANVGAALTASPYTFSWNTASTSNGSHTLRAILTDTANNTATSPAVTVVVSNAVVDTTPPTVTITAPANNATVSGTITLSATATDPDSPVSFVQFRVDGVNSGAQLTSSPYSMSLNTSTLSNGSHSLTAIAQDPSGNQGTSTAVAVTVSNVADAPAPTLATIALVQQAELSVSSGASSVSQSFSAASTSGDLIVATVKWGGQNLTVTSITDSKGNTYQSVAGPTNWNGTAKVGQTFVAKNISGGAAITITVRLSGASTSNLHLYQFEYSGADTANPIDASSSATGTGTALSSPAVSTNYTKDLLHAVAFTAAGTTSAGSGFKAITTYGGNLVETETASSPGSYTATASDSASAAWFIHLLAIKPASTGTSGSASSAMTVSVTAPANQSTVSGSVTLTATATDSNAITAVQFQVDGANTGSALTSSPYSISWASTNVANGSHVITATAQDSAGDHATSAGVTITVSNATTTSSSMGPLVKSGTNSHYFVNPAGQAVFLSGSHTWNDFQDLGNAGGTVAMDFNAYVSFLVAHGQNATILWHKDLPQYCGWGAGGVWSMDSSTGMPWVRSSTAGASDGGNKFDLSTFNQAYFDRLRARVIQLQQNGIYAVVQLFDASDTASERCGTTAPTGDGYPFTGVNNINGVDDGYVSGSSGSNSFTMTSNDTISNYQDAYVKEVIDTLNDLPNVLWEINEEAPAATATWWAPHMLGLIHAYEGGGSFEGTTYTAKPYQHPVGWPTATYPGNDSQLYGSTADWIAPILSSGFPSVVSPNNQGKVVLNDTDHSLYYVNFLNSDGSVQNQNLRGFAWENLTSGAGGVLFMDPYDIYWQGSPVRNSCTPTNPANGVCTGVDTKYEPFRDTLGYLVSFASKLDLVKTTPQGGLSSTGYCLAQTPAVGAEYLVYAPNGGSFTVNLSATKRTLNVEWLNPATGATSSGGTVTGGATNQSFTAPFSGDAVLYLVDAAGHN